MGGLLESLLRGGKKREEYDDFASRYDQGSITEGYSDEEAVRYHDEVARELSPDDYESSAREAFERMSPQERMQFGQYMKSQARSRDDFDGNFDDVDDDRLQDPGALAQMTRRVHERKPDMLGGLLGGGGGGGGGGGLGGMLGNPMAKAALGGIAAMAVKRMIRR